MFYSTEVLTSRKYGVATVWLVATLGSRSTLKKINRKAIQDVNVPKACRTIVDPVAPMALRLQGNLLYGVSRVYMQQCDYVLSDAQNAQNAMNMVLKTVENGAIDPNAGKAKPCQLILQDDPSFLPELALPPPEILADIELGFPAAIARSGESQSLTPFRSQQTHATPGGQIGGLIIPSSSPGTPGEFRIVGGNEPGSIGGPGGTSGEEGMFEMLGDPEFDFDTDGNLIEYTPRNRASNKPAGAEGAPMHSDGGISARVRQDHEEGELAGIEFPNNQMNLDLPIHGDDLPEGEAFPVATQQSGGELIEVVESSSTVAAPMRRKKRAARVLPQDRTSELHNRDLSSWNNNYLQNMQAASQVKSQKWAAIQAKKNAEYYVWGSGIGGIGRHYSGTKGATPFDKFYGDNLFELFTGISRNPVAGRKHDRDSGIDEATQEESRRVRHKPADGEEQVGRGIEDEGMIMPEGDEVELPRDAPSALDDQQLFSAMPWNIGASIRGSSTVARSGQIGMMGSAIGPSFLADSQGRCGGRTVSASPLQGRGQPRGLDALKSLEGEDEFGNLSSDVFSFPGPGISSDVGDAVRPQPSARVREALSAEGENFLTFVSDGIVEKRNRRRGDLENEEDALQVEAAGDINEVLFEDLLPPSNNSRMIACQGFMMVLALGTKGLLNVRQSEDFEEISLSLTDMAKAMQMEVEVEVVGEGREEANAQGEGRFEEQFTAGHGQGNDDQNSPYAD